MDPDPRRVAEQVRAALVRAALAAYEDAAVRGLCCEGAWEVAVGAMRELDLTGVVSKAAAHPDG
ncbi:MAG TPA: hypothetical protein VFZ26_12960 [Gemmatimonadales bacterium]